MATALDNFYSQDASRIEGEILRIQRNLGRVSALMVKGELPMGIGFNYISLIHKRSVSSGGGGWVSIAQENGSTNNCAPSLGTVNPAQTQLTYTAEQNGIQSNRICFTDLYRAYDAEEQVADILNNFVLEVKDVWEDRDKLAFFTNAGHKIICNETLTESTGATMPAVVPTTRPIQAVLDILYQRIVQDGGGMEPYAMAGGAPVLPLITSMYGQRSIIKEDASVRQDVQYAEMGKGQAATLLQSWGVTPKSYGGFLPTIDNKMPRWNFTNGAWVSVPYYINQSTTIGNEAIVNPAYFSAGYEDMYIWHPEVVKRLMPKPMSSFGSKTSGNPVDWNGDVFWANVQNIDSTSPEYNPYGNWGRYLAALQAAYKPGKTQYGYVLRWSLCNTYATNPCYVG